MSLHESDTVRFKRMRHESQIESHAIIEKHKRIGFYCYFKYSEWQHPRQFEQLQNQINEILYGNGKS